LAIQRKVPFCARVISTCVPSDGYLVFAAKFPKMLE
jgi:hypothetical protein